MQLSSTEVCIVGGSTSLISRDYNAPNSCLTLDIVTGEITVKSNMKEERMYHSVCSIGLLVIVVGGIERSGKQLRNGECFHWHKNRWTDLGTEFDSRTIGVTLVAVRKRFVYAFRGKDKNNKEKEGTLVRRLDI